MEERKLRKRTRNPYGFNTKIARRNEISRAGLMDVPNEVIADKIFQYLSPIDIDAFSRIGNSRLRRIAKDNTEGTNLSCISL